jgi:hypothetical protein
MVKKGYQAYINDDTHVVAVKGLLAVSKTNDIFSYSYPYTLILHYSNGQAINLTYKDRNAVNDMYDKLVEALK